MAFWSGSGTLQAQPQEQKTKQRNGTLLGFSFLFHMENMGVDWKTTKPLLSETCVLVHWHYRICTVPAFTDNSVFSFKCQQWAWGETNNPILQMRKLRRREDFPGTQNQLQSWEWNQIFKKLYSFPYISQILISVAMRESGLLWAKTCSTTKSENDPC